ncbi:MAG: hypothetical protein ACJAQ1_000973, partial [Flavobacterium sp.]
KPPASPTSIPIIIEIISMFIVKIKYKKTYIRRLHKLE